MKHLRWQFLIVVLALAAIAVLLFSQQQEVVPGGDPEVEPVSGGVYTEALIGSLGRLNPVLDYYNSVDQDVNRLLFSSLVRFDHRGLPYGDLAETWGISADGERYSFSIKAEAFWHDGQPVTSDDVIFTIEFLRSEELPLPEDLRNFWDRIEVNTLDEKTIQFILPEPFAPFIDYLTFGILPAHLLGEVSPQELIDSPFNLQPVGSGPYSLQSVEAEDERISSVTLQAFDGYHGGKPFIEQVIFQYYPDSISAMEAYQSGDVMGISQVTLDILPQALKESNLNLYTSRLPRMGMIFLNLDSEEVPFFQEPDVRRSLLMGINRRWIVDRIMGSQAILANSPIFPESWAYFPGVGTVEYDPDEAIELLKKNEYEIPAEGGQVRSKEGVSLSFEMVYPDIAPYPVIAERIKSEWSRIGVRVELVEVTYEEMLADYLEPRNYQAALVELNLANSPDPDPYPFWHQTQINSGQNYARWNDRQVSEYLERARINVDLDERIKLYRNFQVRFSADIPALLLFYPVYTYAVDSQVKGVSIGPLSDPSDRFNSITSWFLFIAPSDQVTGAPATSTEIP